METRGCAERGGEIRGRSVIKSAIIDMSWEEEGEQRVSPQRALHASLMVLTEMLYNLCVTGASRSVFMVPHMWKARLHFQAHLWRGYRRLRSTKCNNPACDHKERAGLRPPVYTTDRGKMYHTHWNTPIAHINMSQTAELGNVRRKSRTLVRIMDYCTSLKAQQTRV